MSLASSIKEFSDRLNELNGILPTHAFLFELFISSLRSGFSGLFYLVSFQWFRDFSYLPLLAPQINPSSSFSEPSYFEETVNHFFSFSRTTGIQSAGNTALVLRTRVADPLISGFVNSFFFSLPFSLSHLVSIRRLFSQGSIAAASSVLGQLAAHSIFLIGVLYGLRFLIIPWFALEPLNYIVGLFVVGAIVNEMVLDKNVYLMPSRQKPSLVRIGILSFVLTWCEEVSVFHSLNHLTLNAQNTYLDLYPANSAVDGFLVHTVYLLAFIIGNVGFSALFYYLLFKSGQYISL